MSSGKIITVDGKIATSNGKIATSCVTPGEPCVYCPGTTPASITLVFSGITFCAPEGVCYTSGTFLKWIVQPPSPNGTYILNQAVGLDNCYWGSFQVLDDPAKSFGIGETRHTQQVRLITDKVNLSRPDLNINNWLHNKSFSKLVVLL